MQRKAISGFIVVILFFFFYVFSFTNAQIIDTTNSWAKDVIEKWHTIGIIKGEDSNGNFMPENIITRAEFVTLVCRVLNLSEKADIHFGDIQGNEWYADEISKAVSAGLLQGDDKGNVNPLSPISREEAAVIFSRAFDLKASIFDLTDTFNDAGNVADWSKESVCAMAEGGYITGRPGKLFAPTGKITRAEAVKIVDNIVGDLKNKSGTYTGEIKKNIVVNSSDIQLKDMTIKGNLYLTSGIGDGNIVLDNVTVKGKIIVRGAKDFNLKGNVEALNILKKGTNIRLSEESKIKTVTLDSDANITGTGTIEEVNINAQGVIIEQNPTIVKLKKGITAKVAKKTISNEISSGSSGSGGTSGGSSSSGGTSGGSSSGGGTTGGNTSSGGTTGGNTSSGGTTGGNTSSGGTTGGNTSSGGTAGGSCSNRELLTNGDFEDFTRNFATGWSKLDDGKVQLNFQSDNGKNGRAQKIDVLKAGDWGLIYYQKPILELNKKYKVSFSYKTNTNSVFGFSVSDSKFQQLVLSQFLNGTNGEWKDIEYTFVYNNSAADMVRITTNSVDSIWLDNFSLKCIGEISSGDSDLIFNADFEAFNGSMAAGWNVQDDGKVQLTYLSDNGKTGKAQRIDIQTAGQWGVIYYQKPILELNKIYKVNFSYKTSTSAAIGFAVSDAPLGKRVLNRPLSGTNGVWKDIEYTFTYTNVGADMVRITTNNIGSLWIDNFSLKCIGVAPAPTPGGDSSSGGTSGGSSSSGESSGENPSGVAVSNTPWRLMPIRSQQEFEQGLIGGEGEQHPHGIARCLTSPNVIYLSHDVSGVWRSENGGTTWQKALDKGLLEIQGLAIEVDPINPNIVFETINKGWNYKTPDCEGIYRSKDGGDTWTRVLNTKSNYDSSIHRMYTHNIAYDLSSISNKKASRWYAAFPLNGLYRSDDSGDTWKMISSLADHTSVYGVYTHPSDGKTVYVCTNKGLFKSTDMGVTLNKIGNLPIGDVTSLAINTMKPDTIYVNVKGLGVFVSTDGGNKFISLLDYDTTRVFINPGYPNILYAVTTYNTIFNSHDGGKTWNRNVKTIHAPGLQRGYKTKLNGALSGVVPNPENPDEAVAYSQAALWKTTDGGYTFVDSSTLFSGFAWTFGLYSIIFDKFNPDRFMTLNCDVGPALTENGSDWFVQGVAQASEWRRANLISWTTSTAGDFKPVAGSKEIVATIGNYSKTGLMYSEDDGQNWKLIADPKPIMIYFVSYNTNDPNIVYAGNKISKDGGKTFQLIDFGQFSNLGPYTIGMCKSQPDTVYALGNSGYDILRSDDKGTTWRLYAHLTWSVRPFDSMPTFAADPVDPNKIYTIDKNGDLAIYDGKAWRSTGLLPLVNKIGNWNYVNKIAIDPKHTEIIYAFMFASGIENVWRSQDGGNTWENVSSNLPRDGTGQIAVNPNTGELFKSSFAGTFVLPPPYKSSNQIYDKLIDVPAKKELTSFFAPPTNLNATVINNQVNLTWVNSTDNYSGVIIERSIDGNIYLEVSRVNAGITSYVDKNVQSGNSYFYRVRAYRGNEKSLFLNTTVAEVGDISNIYYKYTYNYGPELLANGDFEEFTGNIATGWSKLDDGIVQINLQSDIGKTGKAQRIDIQKTGVWGAIYYQKPKLEANKQYTLSFSYKTNNNRTFGFSVSNATFDKVLFSQTLNGTNGEWKEAEYTFKYSMTAADLLQITSNNEGSIWIDNFSLKSKILQ